MFLEARTVRPSHQPISLPDGMKAHFRDGIILGKEWSLMKGTEPQTSGLLGVN